ncbi:aldose epimerase family protein [Tabrizicola sp.]|jgi:aldose 1-epimerase|uniref:aldose epimerase family protein n=1 Tax=Tabrizicola sp. TaxID=2005166 RepID=UPI001A5EDAAC|nr:aldose epimerase family protein [Tabrizicola sp.]MBL9060922.1 galactose mutarotase [Tabrizicola sp.]
MAMITGVGQIDGLAVHQATLTGPNGLRVVLLTWGARLAQLWVPDVTGSLADIVLGHDTLSDWQAHGTYVGATCGRYANRIAGGRFPLDDRAIQLDRNEGRNTLHGGSHGFDQKHWTIDSHSDAHVTFATTSPDGEMGFPGTLQARTTYRIDGAALTIEMEATTDAPTIVNLVNHAYFNLAGQGAGDIMDHQLQIEARHYLPVDAQLIPTGEVLSVANTAFDFRQSRPIGAAIPGPGGFDHNFCLSGPAGADGLRPCLIASDPASDRRMRLSTTEPGVQLYTGAHFANGPGKVGARYSRFAGFAVETQRFPDAPNNPQFPSARLNPGQTYRHLMRFDFSPAP